MPCPHAPLPTLHLHPHGYRRTARGGSWSGYSFSPEDFHLLPSCQLAWLFSAQNQQAPRAADRSGARTPLHAGSVAASLPTAAPAAAGPRVARADSSAQNRRAELVVAAPGSEHDQRTTPGSAQNQQAARVPDRSADRTSRYAGSVDGGFPTRGPVAAGTAVARAGSPAQNQQAPRAGKGPSRTDAELHCGVRARLLGDGTAARPPAPESARARRGRRHIPEAVRRAVWRRDGGTCCYQDPLTGVTCGSTHLVQIDHIVPVAQGGTDDIANLRLRCMVHNRRRDPRCASYRSAPAA